ncbi:MAG TPA: hypothetical protein DGG95_14815 [Cytophagales bacterium]|jgi:hypothetical protein|nr:hypothetical protein [Cytophagales bacterium]
MSKTVYILGAGFSMPAGAPSQGGLIKNIFELKKGGNARNKIEIKKWVNDFENFLGNSLCIDRKRMLDVTFEDIFTPLDRCLIDEISFRDMDLKTLDDKREKFYNLIIIALRNSLQNRESPYIEQFAKHLVKLARKRLKDEKNDAVSVISTNWDILLDNSIQNLINNEAKPRNADFSGVVDYCCYISSLDENDSRIKPGLYALGKGRYNVKLLKLHGSMNWLQCPKCQRLFVKFYRFWTGGYVFHKQHCRHCKENFKSSDAPDTKLRTNLIMPTFLKDLNNFQIKLIWQNAGIELSEADQVVFIGYSLPQADFELRQLLSRMIRKDAKIEIVLTDHDDPKNYSDSSKHNSAGFRYGVFFSGRRPKIFYDGVEKYIDDNFK